MITQEQKETWINYFQYLHSVWSNDFVKNLSIGKCLDSSIKQNIIITNLISLFYRYEPFVDTPTLAYSFEFPADTTQEYIISITQNSNQYELTGLLPETMYELLEIIQNGLPSIYMTIVDNIVYVYGYSDFYDFSDLPIINIEPVEGNLPGFVPIEITDLQNSLSTILDNINCLTFEQICKLKSKIILLTKNRNCN